MNKSGWMEVELIRITERQPTSRFLSCRTGNGVLQALFELGLPEYAPSGNAAMVLSLARQMLSEEAPALSAQLCTLSRVRYDMFLSEILAC